MAATEKRRRGKKELPDVIKIDAAPWGEQLFGRLTEPEGYDFVYSPRIDDSGIIRYGMVKEEPGTYVFDYKFGPDIRLRQVGAAEERGLIKIPHNYPSSQLMLPTVRGALQSGRTVAGISDRVNLLLDLVGETHVLDALRPLETSDERQQWTFRFSEERAATIVDYVSFLNALDQLYKLFLSVLRVEYFVNVWIKSKALEIAASDEIRIISISKHSPDNLKVEGLAAGLKAVGEALSIGDQVQKIRTAGIKVDEAKLELRKKEIEVAEAERQARIRAGGTDMELLLEVEKKHAELDAIRRKSEEEDIRLKKMKLEYFSEAFETLGKTLQLLDRMPPSLKSSFEQLLQQKIDELLIQPPYRLEAAEAVAAADTTP